MLMLTNELSDAEAMVLRYLVDGWLIAVSRATPARWLYNPQAPAGPTEATELGDLGERLSARGLVTFDMDAPQEAGHYYRKISKAGVAALRAYEAAN
jgi:hypothetical protein